MIDFPRISPALLFRELAFRTILPFREIIPELVEDEGLVFLFMMLAAVMFKFSSDKINEEAELVKLAALIVKSASLFKEPLLVMLSEDLMSKVAPEIMVPKLVKLSVKVSFKFPMVKISLLLMVEAEVKSSLEFDKMLPEFVKDELAIMVKSELEKRIESA